MNVLRYLTFEANRTCDLAAVHSKCPIGHPERYRFSRGRRPMPDDMILDFYRFCLAEGFGGIVLWHNYNEPTLALNRIYRLMSEMKAFRRKQAFQLTTNVPPADGAHFLKEFEIVAFSDYDSGVNHDNRIENAKGEGNPYSQMPRRGLCARGRGWEVLIDYFGNWNLCCADWRCEESIGSLWDEPWGLLRSRWEEKRLSLQWSNEAEYNALPRMCRACMKVTPDLHKRGGL